MGLVCRVILLREKVLVGRTWQRIWRRSLA
jgi:hypothetical protein